MATWINETLTPVAENAFRFFGLEGVRNGKLLLYLTTLLSG
jgi:hypothetical protein